MRNNRLTEEEKNIVRLMADLNMNGSAVAKAVYLHRNSMIYKFKVIERKTGYNIRHFWDLCDLLDDIDNGMHDDD